MYSDKKFSSLFMHKICILTGLEMKVLNKHVRDLSIILVTLQIPYFNSIRAILMIKKFQPQSWSCTNIFNKFLVSCFIVYYMEKWVENNDTVLSNQSLACFTTQKHDAYIIHILIIMQY